MDYSINRVVQRVETDENTKEYGAIGEMPDDPFLSKFETTNMGEDDDEQLLTEYQRQAVAKGHGPDKPLFEHEETRRDPEASVGRLRMQYGGHRGDADDPAHPEAMLDFYGEVDPRGINVDPNMGLVRKQSEARGRFVNWSRDTGVDSTTGGSAGEFKIMQDKRKAWAQSGARLRIFSRTIDGRQNGMRGTWKHVNPQKLGTPGDEQYGEYTELIKQDAMNPNKNGIVIAEHILSKSAAFINGMNQQDLAVARDTFARRRRTESATMRAIKATENQIDFTKSETAQLFKSLAETMHSKTKMAKHTATDADFGAARADARAGRMANRADEDVRMIMNRLVQQHDVGKSYVATAAHYDAPGKVMKTAEFVVQDAEDPASYKLVSEMIYKLAQAGPSDNQIVWSGVGDAEKRVMSEHFAVTKTAAREKYKVTQAGAYVDIGDDQTKKVPVFSTAVMRAANEAKQRMVNGEAYAGESTETSVAKSRERASAAVNQKRDRYTIDNGFGRNLSMDKSTGPLGEKHRSRRMIVESTDRNSGDFA